MELFHENGHLSDEGLAALENGSLDELRRLEAAEHLAFCDDCLSHQLAVLDAAPDKLLPAPRPGFAQDVARRTQGRGRGIAFRRMAPAVAAVCLVAAMWVAGFFLPAGTTLQAVPKPNAATTAAAVQRDASFVDAINERARDISSAMNNFFLSLRTPQQPEEPATP